MAGNIFIAANDRAHYLFCGRGDMGFRHRMMTVNEAAAAVLDDIKPGRAETGLAFEYAMVMALQNGIAKKRGIEVVVEKSPRLDRLKRAFEDIPASSGRRETIVECAKLAAGALLRKFGDLRGPIMALEDSAGAENEQGGGSVCDLQIGRAGGRFLGVSCKLNNDELKHNRMSSGSSLVRSSFDEAGGAGSAERGESLADRMAEKIFRRFAEVAGQEMTWDNFKTSGDREGERLIRVLMKLSQREFRKIVAKANLEGKQGAEARRLIEFVLGPEDYVIVRADDKNKKNKKPTAELRFHNPGGSLGEGISRTTLPDRVVRIESDPKKESTAFRVIFASQGTDGQMGFRMRLHSAAGLVTPSLKWSVKWTRVTKGEGQQSHCWEVEKAIDGDGAEIQTDFLKTTLGPDELAIRLAAVALLPAENRSESFQALCGVDEAGDLARVEGISKNENPENVAVALRGILGARRGEEHLPPEFLIRACMVRMSKDMGRHVPEEDLKEIHEGALAVLTGLVTKAIASKYFDPENAGEVEAELRNLLPSTGDAFQFGVAKGSTAKAPDISQKVKTILCEIWRGGGAEGRVALQAIAALRPGLASKKTRREGAALTQAAAEELGKIGIVDPNAIELLAKGYHLNGMRFEGFPFEGRLEDKAAWFDQLQRPPVSDNWEKMRDYQNKQRLSFVMELSSIVSVREKLGVGRFEEKEKAENREPGSRGAVSETAQLLATLDGRPMMEVAMIAAAQISRLEDGAKEQLVVNAVAAMARKGGLVNLEEEFHPRDLTSCKKIVGIMSNIRGCNRDAVPAEFLILAASGDIDSILSVAGRTLVEKREEGQRYDLGACIEMVLGGKQPAGAYPFDQGAGERAAWRDGLTTQNLYQRKGEGGVVSFMFPKEIVLLACDMIDQAWGGGRGDAKTVLRALLTVRETEAEVELIRVKREGKNCRDNLVESLRVGVCDTRAVINRKLGCEEFSRS